MNKTSVLRFAVVLAGLMGAAGVVLAAASAQMAQTSNDVTSTISAYFASWCF